MHSYINSNTQKEKEERASYKSKLRDINISLNLMQIPELPDLTCNPTIASYIINNKIIAIILEDRQKQIDLRNEIMQKHTKIENNNYSLGDKTDILNTKIKDLSLKVEYFKNQLSIKQEKCDKDLEKLQKEKEDILKSLNKVVMKESHYKHEIKKLEMTLEEIKNNFKKKLEKNYFYNNKDNLQSYNANSNTTNYDNYKNEKILILKNNVNLSNNNSNNTNSLLSNTIVFDNFLKNSPSIILNQVNYSKDFYSLIFNSFNNKYKFLKNENKELKSCLKFLKDQIVEYIDLKKAVMYEYTKDILFKLDVNSKNNSTGKNAFYLKDLNQIINKDIFNLDFKTSKNEIFELFNEVIDNFRFILLYEFYNIDPKSEFEFDKVKANILKNNKFDICNIPYFNNIKESIDKLNFDKLIKTKVQLENTIKDSYYYKLISNSNLDNKNNEDLTKEKKNNSDYLNNVNKKIEIEDKEHEHEHEHKHDNDNDIININIPDVILPDDNVYNMLEDIEQDLDENMNHIEGAFKNLEEKIMEEIKEINNIDFIDKESSNNL